MAVRRILLLGNPILRTRCSSVKEFSSKETRRTIVNLRDTLVDFRKRRGFGRGIAAPQIGSTLSIIFIRLCRLDALINPKIIKRSTQMIELWDDCFSFREILVKVRRHRRIEVSYVDEAGERKTLKAADTLSELLQHEIDHVNGVLAIDRAVTRRDIILRSEFQRLS
jgi:peptide deformylase